MSHPMDPECLWSTHEGCPKCAPKPPSNPIAIERCRWCKAEIDADRWCPARDCDQCREPKPPSTPVERHGCQYCDHPLDATKGVGIYECPRCIAHFPDGLGYEAALQAHAEEAVRVTEERLESEQEESEDGWADVAGYAVRQIEKGETEKACDALRNMAECLRKPTEPK